MMDLHFLRPHYLTYLWAIVPAVLALWYLGFELRRRARLAFGEAKLVDRTTRPMKLAGEAAVAILWVAAIVLLVASASGPVSKSLPTNVKAGSLQVVAVVDVSKSMAAEEYRPFMPAKGGYAPDMVPGPYGSRLDYVKHILQNQVMPAITGNQLGVVTYTGQGFEQVPLTDDWTSSKWVMNNWMKVGNAPGGGSDYAEGLSMALKMFDRDQIAGREKVILLFTDGGFTGDKKALAETLALVNEKKVRLIVIGVGTPAPSPIPVYNATGQLTGYFKIEDKVVMTGRDDAELGSLVSQSGAEYIPLDLDGDGQLHISWASTLGGSKAEIKEDPVFQYPLGMAIVILFGLFMRGLLPRRSLVR